MYKTSCTNAWAIIHWELTRIRNECFLKETKDYYDLKSPSKLKGLHLYYPIAIASNLRLVAQSC